jgi:hypothetical protein
MQRNDPEKREVLEVRELERPLGRGLTPIDAVIEVVKSDCAEEWAQYCHLARLDAVYAPRPVFFSEADLPTGRPTVLFAEPETIRSIRNTNGSVKLGEVIYENDEAITDAFRTPGRRNTIGPLQVVRILDRAK